MRRLGALALAVGLLFTLASPVVAKKPVQTGSISLLTADPALGVRLDFAWSADPEPQRPRVEVLCWQPVNTTPYSAIYDPVKGYLTYAEARGLTERQADYIGTYPVVLGGGMSVWLLQGGPASCEANLFYFDDSGPTQQYVRLASATFEATG